MSEVTGMTIQVECVWCKQVFDFVPREIKWRYGADELDNDLVKPVRQLAKCPHCDKDNSVEVPYDGIG
jgi:hypothetical protein